MAPVFGSILPALVILGLFSDLPRIIQKRADFDEAEDFRRAELQFQRNEVEEFDYVIIGAGSAGAVVANRLSKYARNRVLILQDGGDPTPFSKIPGFVNEIRNQPSVDYRYKITKQKYSCLAKGAYNSTCLINRGKGLGGSSNLYSMSVIEGNPADYDRWAEIAGDSAWAYENVQSVFKSLENYHGYFQPIDTVFHGLRGESYISKQQPSDFLPHFFDACAQLGLRTNIDPNANQSVGCGHLDLNIKHGARWGTYSAFLEPILRRPNLKIYRFARATRILFDKNMRATGIKYVRHGVQRTVRTKHEVILCAGAIDSPKVLLVSGIGPKAALDSVGLKQLLDLPVGVGLDEHVGTNLVFTVNSSVAFIPQRDFTVRNLEQYTAFGQGPIASPFFNPRAVAFMSSSEFPDPNWPDIELLPRGEYQNTLLENGTFLNMFSVQVSLMRPLSSGSLRLASSDSSDPPIIDPRFFSHPSDMARLIEVCHPTGTVKMGRRGDASAVLDSKLRVFGTRGLRVVDSSIMPTTPTGHTHTPTLMIGEIGSKFILESRKTHVF